MRYPVGLLLDSTKHLVTGRLRGDRKPVVMLSLNPMGRPRNGYAAHAISASGEQEGFVDDRPMLTVEQCIAAMEECPTPVVTIGGSEPLEYPDIAALSREILSRGKHLFLTTDGTLIRRRMHMIPPLMNFFWNVKLSGTEAVHDALANQPGTFREAIDGVRAVKNAGFFVVVSTAVGPETDMRDVAKLFATLHSMHVDGYRIEPQYHGRLVGCSESAAIRNRMHQKFREAEERLGGYNLMVSPLYLEYLRGERELDCCAWGSPTYGPEGWSAPCSLLSVTTEASYKNLLANTVWENYGRGINPRCELCMCHKGFETAALLGVNAKAGDLLKLLRWQLGGNLGEKRAKAMSA